MSTSSQGIKMTTVNATYGINPFTQAPAIQQARNYGSGSGAAYGGGYTPNENSSSSTVGVNTNIGIGDTSYIPAQAGKAAGSGRTLAIA